MWEVKTSTFGNGLHNRIKKEKVEMGYIIKKDSLENLAPTKHIEGKRSKGKIVGKLLAGIL